MRKPIAALIALAISSQVAALTIDPGEWFAYRRTQLGTYLLSRRPCIDQDNSNGRLLWRKELKMPQWKAGKFILKNGFEFDTCWQNYGPREPDNLIVCTLFQDDKGNLKLRGSE